MRTFADLVKYRHPNASAETIATLLESELSTGALWENVLADLMKDHTTQLPRNAWYKDYTDGTDAKFAVAGRVYQRTGTPSSSIIYATVNHKNKTGTLRVCLCDSSSKQLFYMLIPHSHYSKYTGPLKINFSCFRPIGNHWNNFQCKFTDVYKPVV